jgi:hypothetical protein
VRSTAILKGRVWARPWETSSVLLKVRPKGWRTARQMVMQMEQSWVAELVRSLECLKEWPWGAMWAIRTEILTVLPWVLELVTALED